MEIDTSDEILDFLKDNEHFVAQVGQTLLITQEVYNGFKLLLGKYEVAINEAQNTLESSKENLEATKELFLEFTNQKEQIQQALQESQNLLETTKAEVEKQLSELQNLTQTNSELNSQIQEAANKVLELKNEINYLIEQLGAYEQTIQTIKELIATIPQLKQEVILEITQTKEEAKKELQVDNFVTRVEFEDLKEKIPNSKGEAEEIKDSIEGLEEEIKNLQDSITALKEEIAQKKELLNDLQSQLSQKEAALEELEGLIEQAQQSGLPTDELEAKKEELQKEIEGLKEQISQIEGEIAQKEEEVAQKEQEITQKEEEITQKEEEALEKEEEELEKNPPKNPSDLITKHYLEKNYVSKGGDESISGVKTFTTPPISKTNPRANNQVANKAYVDSVGNAKVALSGNQTIAGNKTFSGATTTAALTANGAITAKSTLAVTGNTTIAGTLTANGAIALNGSSTFKLIPNCAVKPTGNNHLANKLYVDNLGGVVSSGAAIDFRKGNHFMVNLSANAQISVANWGGVAGKSGTITILNANRITGFKAPFNFRIAQSGFSGTEVFSYYCYASNLIRIVRS